MVIVAHILTNNSSELFRRFYYYSLDSLSLKLLKERLNKGIIIHLSHPVHTLGYPVAL
jgi:hypothetical protein